MSYSNHHLEPTRIESAIRFVYSFITPGTAMEDEINRHSLQEEATDSEDISAPERDVLALLKQHYEKSVTGRLLRNMKDGDVGWVNAHALIINEDRHAYLNLADPIWDIPFESEPQIRIVKLGNSWEVNLCASKSFKWNVAPKTWQPDEHHFGKVERFVSPKGESQLFPTIYSSSISRRGNLLWEFRNRAREVFITTAVVLVLGWIGYTLWEWNGVIALLFGSALYMLLKMQIDRTDKILEECEPPRRKKHTKRKRERK